MVTAALICAALLAQAVGLGAALAVGKRTPHAGRKEGVGMLVCTALVIGFSYLAGAH